MHECIISAYTEEGSKNGEELQNAMRSCVKKLEVFSLEGSVFIIIIIILRRVVVMI